jgi:plasmid replication initiation protein
MSRQKTLADREQYVVKANELIRRTRYDLTAQQQKIVLFAISKIKPDDDIGMEYTFDLNELANACGIEIREGGYYYSKLKEDLKRLATPTWILVEDKESRIVDRMISWINSDAEISPGDSTVKISFNKHLQPYLFDLSEQYTQYMLRNALVFRGKYSIRLYEIMRSYTTQRALDNGTEKDIIISLDDLRYLLVAEVYKRWVDFDRFVIKPAVAEINKRAEDIHIEYEPMRGDHTRAIESINFIITSARAGQKLEAKRERKKQLDHVSI